tara:strand:+ start:83 stop:706 length:624 start_codon:yes stop_codon:yes gene_type:complete
MPIYRLFPEPVYFSKLDRALTKKELKDIAQYKGKVLTSEQAKNLGNSQTIDSYILEHKTLKNLKKDLTKTVIDYFNKIVCTNNSIIPYITQSWLNYTETNQFHHSHAHFNSYVSGVFYIDAKKGVDHIVFNKSGHRQLKLSIAQPNEFNSSTYSYPVESGDIILFSSSLTHGVASKEGTNTRTSLAFNVFFKGTIGKKEELTELVLE